MAWYSSVSLDASWHRKKRFSPATSVLNSLMSALSLIASRSHAVNSIVRCGNSFSLALHSSPYIPRHTRSPHVYIEAFRLWFGQRVFPIEQILYWFVFRRASERVSARARVCVFAWACVRVEHGETVSEVSHMNCHVSGTLEHFTFRTATGLNWSIQCGLSVYSDTSTVITVHSCLFRQNVFDCVLRFCIRRRCAARLRQSERVCVRVFIRVCLYGLCHTELFDINITWTENCLLRVANAKKKKTATDNTMPPYVAMLCICITWFLCIRIRRAQANSAT